MKTIYDYLRAYGTSLAERILETYPPQHRADEAPRPELFTLKRPPLPAQAIAVSGLVRYLESARSAHIVAECGTGKTYMALATFHALAKGQPRTTLVMCPPHITRKWAREALITVPGARCFLVEDLRDGGDRKRPHGVVEVKLKNGRVTVDGLTTSLPALRMMGRKEWRERVNRPSYFIMGKDRAKLGYRWRDAFVLAKSGKYMGFAVNPDSGRPIEKGDGEVLVESDFIGKEKRREWLTRPKDGSKLYSPLWQADRADIRRTAPLDYIGRFMHGWWDFAIADEVHQLAGDTAQGNGLGVLRLAADRLLDLTGTLMGGYADDLFNIFWRTDPKIVEADGFVFGGEGRRDFQSLYGVLETIERTREDDRAYSRASKKTVTIKRRPGASPLLFGKYLMHSTAFLSLEDIAEELPGYEESVLTIGLPEGLKEAYGELESEMRAALKEHRGNRQVLSLMLNTLLLYPDHPHDWKPLEISVPDDEGGARQVVIANPENFPADRRFTKEARLIEDIRAEMALGRKFQIYATYTGEKDVTARLQRMLREAGIRVAVLKSSVPTDKREDWYEQQLAAGVDGTMCHPKLVETGMDLLEFPTLYYFQTGYSLHTLRQSSRRSWRIGQRQPVRVKFLAYESTMQETCLRLMGKKLLVALMMEGKFSGEGLGALDDDEDMLSAMARELVTKARVGDSADQVWRELNRERSTHLPAKAVPNQPAIHLVPPRPKPDVVWPTAVVVGQQLSLFG